MLSVVDGATESISKNALGTTQKIKLFEDFALKNMYTKEGIDCYVQAELAQLKERVNKLKRREIVVIHDTDNHPAKNAYLRNKIKLVESVGLKVRNEAIDDPEELIEKILMLRFEETPYLVQLPHKNVKLEDLSKFLSPSHDIDGLSEVNLGRLFGSRERKSNIVIPCTARGIYEHFTRFYKPEPGSTALLIGRSLLVNKPLEIILRDWLNMNVLVAHSKNHVRLRGETPSVIVSAVGKPIYLKDFGFGAFDKENTVIYDVGIRQANGRLQGDLSADTSVQSMCKVTPVPGGVGRLTTLSFLKNAVDLLKGMEP